MLINNTKIKSERKLTFEPGNLASEPKHIPSGRNEFLLLTEELGPSPRDPERLRSGYTAGSDLVTMSHALGATLYWHLTKGPAERRMGAS